jgi:AP-1-like transcription factor
MDNTFADITPLWDLSQATTFSQLADDDFLALLQKQFPASTSPTLNLGTEFAPPSVDPNDISRFSLPSYNPPSEDSSPSPPQNQASSSRQRSEDDDEYRSDLKRKASIDEDDLEEGPSSKAQHTSASNKKGSANSRRKSGGGPDESRLLKRKEQNRAAQRAFRERKEKHVKDLEDKVAALEARNEQANTENDNLRDMLRRLQSENVQLKQGSFTFQVPKNASSTPSSSSLSPPSLSASLSRNSPKPSLDKYTNPLDLSSLTAFDPSMLDLLDEPTATSGGSGMESEFGFNREGGYLTSHFTTIASNPAYFSLASMFDSTPTASPPTTNNTASPNNSFGFDMSSITSSWSMPTEGGDSGTLDDLFGSYLNAPNGMEMTGLLSSSSPSSAISPIMHQATNSHSPSNSTSSGSPSSQGSDAMFGTPRDGSSSESETGHDDKQNQCPKSKQEVVNHINGQGMSPFAPAVAHTPYLKKDAMSPFGVVACQGTSSFPKTQKNDQNIEVLSAWRKITSNPNFKDCDINELCTEFSNKARCDGSKVVLEPSGMGYPVM